VELAIIELTFSIDEPYINVEVSDATVSKASTSADGLWTAPVPRYCLLTRWHVFDRHQFHRPPSSSPCFTTFARELRHRCGKWSHWDWSRSTRHAAISSHAEITATWVHRFDE